MFLVCVCRALTELPYLEKALTVWPRSFGTLISCLQINLDHACGFANVPLNINRYSVLSEMQTPRLRTQQQKIPLANQLSTGYDGSIGFVLQ